MSSNEVLPWEIADFPIAPKRPGITVDIERCIGCHACSIACKTVHAVPLGQFRMRVRWWMHPERDQHVFVPLFAADACDMGSLARPHGRAPECVRACPTKALHYGDRAEADGAFSAFEQSQDAKIIPGRADLHPDVHYIGFEPWMASVMNAGVALSPNDGDITYEQRAPRGENLS